jgi:hypothetical protein
MGFWAAKVASFQIDWTSGGGSIVRGAGREKTLSSRFRLFALSAFVIRSSAQAANLGVGIIEQFNDYIREVEARLAPRNKGLIEIKGGMIQDWQGAVFIKGAKLDSVLRVVRTTRIKLFLSDVLERENDITFEGLNATKVYGIAKSSRIQEVANP